MNNFIVCNSISAIYIRIRQRVIKKLDIDNRSDSWQLIRLVVKLAD